MLKQTITNNHYKLMNIFKGLLDMLMLFFTAYMTEWSEEVCTVQAVVQLKFPTLDSHLIERYTFYS